MEKQKKYVARIKILSVGKNKYIQVVQDIIKDGKQTTKVLRSFGAYNEDKVRQAQIFLDDINRIYNEPNAPCLKVNPQPREKFLATGEGPLGLITPETTPTICNALLTAAEIGVRSVLVNRGLREAIPLLQPYIKTEEDIERFYKWIKDKPFGEQVRLLVKDWYYPQP